MDVVIVDDELINLVILKRTAIGVCGKAVQGFTSAATALDYLKDHQALLVVVDFDMPECDGIEFIHAVRGFPGNAQTPILMVTGCEDASLKARAIEAGATEFLQKPVNWSLFKAELRKLLPSADLKPQPATLADVSAIFNVQSTLMR